MFFRNKLFLEGIALGGLCGIIIGTILAFSLGDSGIEAIRRLLQVLFPRQRTVPFQYLSQ